MPDDIGLNFILTGLAAWYGAVQSLILVVFKFHEYRESKARLKISYSLDFEMIGSMGAGKIVKIEPDRTFWAVTLTNFGGEKLRINQICFERSDTDTYLVPMRDYDGPINKFVLDAGDNRSFTFSYDLIDPQNVKTIVVMDATLKVYKKN